MKKKICFLFVAIVCCCFSGCDSIDDDRIPAVSVNIRLDTAGMWDTYGVGGYGQYRYFIRALRQPANFPYTEATYTGYGGVLLIGGMDPFTSETNVPLAYDMACPVECKADVRVSIDDSNLDAVCPLCGSRYDVAMSGGAPVSGPALTGSVKYKLQSYKVVRSSYGGYNIMR